MEEWTFIVKMSSLWSFVTGATETGKFFIISPKLKEQWVFWLKNLICLHGRLKILWKENCQLLICIRLFETPWTVALPGSSNHGILQARILEWVVIPFSRGTSWPRDRTQVSDIADRFFTVRVTKETIWANREAIVEGNTDVIYEWR